MPTSDLTSVLENPETVAIIDAALVTYNLMSEKEVVMGLLGEVFRGEIDTDDFPFELEAMLDRVDEEIVAFESDIYLDVFLAHEEELHELFEARKPLFADVVSAVQTQFDLSFDDERLKERFVHIAEQLVTGEYDEERTIRSLTKGIKPGGLELTSDIAEKVVAFLVPFVDNVRIEGGEAAGIPLAREKQEVADDVGDVLATDVVLRHPEASQDPSLTSEQPLSTTKMDPDIHQDDAVVQPAALIESHTELVPEDFVDTPEELLKKKIDEVEEQRLTPPNLPLAGEEPNKLQPPPAPPTIEGEPLDKTNTEMQTPQNLPLAGEAPLVTPTEKSPLEVMPQKSEQEKLRREVRAQAQKSQFVKTMVPQFEAASTSMPETPKNVVPTPQTAGVHCDLLEEHEINELIQTNEGIADEIADKPEVHDELREIFTEVVNKFAIKLKSSELCERFYLLVINRLKNLRTSYETRDMVVKSIEAGGLGFSIEEATEFVTYLEAECNKLQLEWQQELDAQKQAYVNDRRDALFGKGSTPPGNMIPTDQKTDDMLGVVERKPEPLQAVMADNLRTARPLMQDVKMETPVLDPIEELRSYSLEDFHRLSSDAVEAALKIEQKIDILGDWMYVKRAEGIDAWKDSGVMRMYREQLQQSLIGDMPLTQVVERRKQAGQLFLTIDEVSALTSLSARLKK